MGNSICGEKSSKCQVFATVVGVKSMYFIFKIFFNNCFESRKDGFDFRFLLERVKPDIFGKMINKDNIIFKTIN